MVGNAGVIEAEVVLVSKKSDEDDVRWVYLDIGKFGGLAETMDESIRYPIRTPRDGDEMAPCVLAGPTCDSADVLYEKEPYQLPGQPGDRRQGADRGHRRLHGDLLVGRLQRLPAAEDRTTSEHARHARGSRRWPAPPSHRLALGLTSAVAARRGAGRSMTMITIRNERLDRHRRARGAARRRLRRRRASPRPRERLREGRAAGRRAVVRRDRATAASSAPCGCGTSRPGRPAGAAARPARGRSGLPRPRHRRRADAARAREARRARPCAPCCWSATRPTTAASASRRRRPARSGCPARYERDRLLGARARARRARRRARPDQRDRRPRAMPDLAACRGPRRSRRCARAA